MSTISIPSSAAGLGEGDRRVGRLLAMEDKVLRLDARLGFAEETDSMDMTHPPRIPVSSAMATAWAACTSALVGRSMASGGGMLAKVMDTRLLVLEFDCLEWAKEGGDSNPSRFLGSRLLLGDDDL